ncbi:MAG: hypothetical protein DRO87_00655 [Candidatus Thorarchaeota archaeon]|nr:MAG: hypothetical protein DRP09_12295 [Candidatus Thorarchaeota archaeon]RLI60186.1 MAG: hypothetical protein DRO87_00655 [Candidatus Thorarchaeota archaeon]
MNDVENRDLRTSMALIRTFEAEKRTHLAELRTGIGILTVPLSLLTILIATSNYYSVEEVLMFILGLVAGIVTLASIGLYLLVRALRALRTKDRLLHELCLTTEQIGRMVKQGMERPESH